MEIPIWPGKTLLQTTSPWRYQRGTNVQQNSEIGSEMKDEGTEESVYLTRHRKSRDGKTLLFVHQTTWQRQLLKRYADVHCMLVRRYILNHQVPPPPRPAPLFFVAVKTNVDYQIVASFVTHDETTESITEALGVLRLVGVLVIFFTDLCEQEINAIESTLKAAIHLQFLAFK